MAQPVIDAIDNQTVPLPQLVAGEAFGQHLPDLTGSAVMPPWMNGITMRRPRRRTNRPVGNRFGPPLNFVIEASPDPHCFISPKADCATHLAPSDVLLASSPTASVEATGPSIWGSRFSVRQRRTETRKPNSPKPPDSRKTEGIPPRCGEQTRRTPYALTR